jgi:hypothetical protein
MIEYALLALSVVLNIFFIWYIRNLLSNLLYISDNLNSLYDELIQFRDHLNKVYELELFYGDETLKNLLRHAKHVAQLLDEYENILLLADDEEQELEGVDDGKSEEA